ncbi:MAG: PEP-CTERM sorting domain-containing protein [Verrucomicrobiota bacterium]
MKTRSTNLIQVGLYSAVIASVLATLPVVAQSIPIANHSFESQIVSPVFFVDTRIDNWQKTPQPGWFTPQGQLQSWDQTAGMFIGTAPYSPNPYSNLDGNQSAYVLSLPGAGIFQDNLSTDWNSTVGGLNATFQPGSAYQFTLGVFGKSMVENYSSLKLSLYYRDGANQVLVGTPTTITFNATTFNPSGPFALVDFSVTTSIVQASDAWAGKNIGISIVSGDGTGAGYWDLDNARLTAVVPEPGTLALMGLGAGILFLGRIRSSGQRQ